MYFHDRTEAGKLLAQALKTFQGKDVIVYALPRGGVVIGYEVATYLHAPLNLLITRKIGHPYEPEYAVGAIGALSDNGHIIWNTKDFETINVRLLAESIQQEHREIRRRRKVYLPHQTTISPKGKIAIIIDDGIATGLTMRAAIQEVKHKHPEKIIVAVPVIAKEVADELLLEVNTVVAILITKYYFGSIGAYYNSFPQLTDDEVIRYLKMSRNNNQQFHTYQ